MRYQARTRRGTWCCVDTHEERVYPCRDREEAFAVAREWERCRDALMRDMPDASRDLLLTFIRSAGPWRRRRRLDHPVRLVEYWARKHQMEAR